MGMKEWLQRLQPAPLYIVLALSIVHFLAQMLICHVTHALTLLVDSCHMLCNIIALVGCIMTVKYDSPASSSVLQCQTEENCTKDGTLNISQSSDEKMCQNEKSKQIADEKSLRNTFGWARIEVLMILIVCVFFTSLCFSILVEALQTLVHINHMDAMHNPFVVLIMGAVGLLLNGFCYLLIGGYTFHQGSFLHVTASGDVVLEGVVTADTVRQGRRRLSHSRKSVSTPTKPHQRQGWVEALRDVISCLFVIMCAIIVYFTDKEVAKYIDPALAIVAASILLALTIPHMKESGLILLQTIPETMNIEALNAELLKTFPIIVNVHDFHVWQLTTSKVVSTVHIVFLNPLDFIRQCDKVTEFLLEQGITQVTIQPEFITANDSQSDEEFQCLMKCKGKGCDSKHCCTRPMPLRNQSPTSIITCTDPKTDTHSKSSSEDQKTNS